MTGKKTIWALTSGAYSDYRVDALFETKELAEAVMRLDPSYYELTSFPLHQQMPVRSMHHQIGVQRRAPWSGQTGVTEIRGGWWLIEVSRPEWPWDWSPVRLRGTGDLKPRTGFSRDLVRFTYEGTDREACLKAAHDKIREWNDIWADQYPRGV